MLALGHFTALGSIILEKNGSRKKNTVLTETINTFFVQKYVK